MESSISSNFIAILILIALWTIPWKGAALWRAAKSNNKGWFIAILLLNTLGIIEILYLFIFSKRKNKSYPN